MNTSVLRKVMMITLLFAGYVTVMGAGCYDPCKDKQENDPCAPEENGPPTGFCSGGQCHPDSP